MEYIFHTSAYDVEQLVPEVSVVLEKRVELASRQRLPGIWKATDSMAQKGGAPGRMTRGRLLYRRIVGAALIVLGLFMMIPGLKEPDKLLLPLIVGICGIVVGAHSLWSTRKKQEKETAEEPAKGPGKKLSKKYETTARNFLTNLANVGGTEVRFSEEGMRLGEHAVIPYAAMEYFFDTPLGYLIAWDRQATFVQKKDLQNGDETEFRGFIACRVSII